jgi:hypothetical protein
MIESTLEVGSQSNFEALPRSFGDEAMLGLFFTPFGDFPLFF